MVYFVAHNDIQSKALELTIASELTKSENFIYLTATQNLKKMRAGSPFLSQGFVPYKNNDTLANLYAVTDFLQYTSKQTYESTEYLSNADGLSTSGKAKEDNYAFVRCNQFQR